MNRRVVVILAALVLVMVVTGVLVVTAAAQAVKSGTVPMARLPLVGGLADIGNRVSIAVSTGEDVLGMGDEAVDEPGAVVIGLVKDGPAVKAGLARGDIVLKADAKDVNDTHDLDLVVQGKKVGDTVALDLRHGDAERTVNVTLVDRGGRPFLGLVLYPGPMGFGHMGLARGVAVVGLGGAHIASVVEGGPAAKAGLGVGDYIVAVDGTNLRLPSDLSGMMAAHKPGETVKLTVVKVVSDQGSAGATPDAANATTNTREVEVVLGDNPAAAGKGYLGVTVDTGPGGLFLEGGRLRAVPRGLDVAPLPELPAGVTKAVIVGQVVKDGPAATAGIEDRDVITAVDGKAVDGANALVDAVAARKPGDSLKLTVLTPGETGTREVAVTLGDSPDAAGTAWLGIAGLGFLNTNDGADGDHFRFRFRSPLKGLPGALEDLIRQGQPAPTQRADTTSGQTL
jgi:S1-C subfamily serine protease